MKKDPVYSFLKIVTFILFSVMSILVFAQVILRYFFAAPLAWSEELSRLLMIWVSFLGIALAFFSKSHASITFLIAKLNGKSKEVYKLLSNLLLLVVFLGLTYYGIRLCIKTNRFCTTILLIPMSVQYASLPVSCAFMSYSIIKDFIFKYLVKGKKGD